MRGILGRFRRGSADSSNKPSDSQSPHHQQHSPGTPAASASTATTASSSLASSPGSSAVRRLLSPLQSQNASPRTATTNTPVASVHPLSLPPTRPITSRSHNVFSNSTSFAASPPSQSAASPSSNAILASPPAVRVATPLSSSSSSLIVLPEPSPRRGSAPDVLDKQQLDVLSPQSAGQAGGFRYIYKDDQNRRRSFDTACLLTIRSSSPQPQPHTPTSPNHSAPTALSPQLSPWLMTYATGGVHAAVRSEEGKAEQASKEEVDAVLRRLVADRRQAMAFVRWLDDDNDARSMRLLMGLVKLVERGEEMKGEDARQDDEDEKGEWRREERVKEFNNAVAAVVSTHLRGKGEKHNHSSLPSLPFPLFRFLLSFTHTLPTSSSSSLLSPSPAASPVPSPYSLARRLLSPQRSSPSVSPLSAATASSLGSPISLSPSSPASSRRRLSLILHLLTQCVYALEQSLYEPHYLSFRAEWHSSLNARTPQNASGYTLRSCLNSATLHGLFTQYMSEERRHRLVTEWAAMHTAIQQTVDGINSANKLAASAEDERQSHDVPLIGCSFSTPISSSMSVRDAYQLFVSLETPYRFMHPDEHARFLASLPTLSSPSSNTDSGGVLHALASLLLLVVPACTRLDSLLSTSYFPAFCETPLFTQLPSYQTLIEIEQHHRYLSPQQYLVLRSRQLLDQSPASLLLSSPKSAAGMDALTSFAKSVYTFVDESHKQSDVHKVEEFRDDLVPDGLVDDEEDTVVGVEQMDQLTVSHATHLPVHLVSEKLHLASLPLSKPLDATMATATDAVKESPVPPVSAVGDVDGVLPRPVLLADAIVLNDLQWKVEYECHPFLDSVNILRRTTPVLLANSTTSTCAPSSTAPLFDPLPSSTPELSYVTNEQALQAELAVSASSSASLLSLLGGSESSSVATCRTDVHSSYPTAVELPAHLLSLCFPLPSEPSSSLSNACESSSAAAVDEFGFPVETASDATEGVQLFPVQATDELGNILYGYVLQLVAAEEEEQESSESMQSTTESTSTSTTISSSTSRDDSDTEKLNRLSSRDSSDSTPAAYTGPPSPVNTSHSIALTRNDSSSFPSTPIDLATDGLTMPSIAPGSRLSSEFLANLQFVVTPPIEDRTLSNDEIERKEQRVRFQFDAEEAGTEVDRVDGSKLEMAGMWVNEPRTQLSLRPSLAVSTDADMELPSSAVKRILEVSPLIVRDRSSEQLRLETEDRDAAVQPVKVKRVMVQYAICLLSRRPLYTQLRALLLTLPVTAGLMSLVSSPTWRALLGLTQPSAVPSSLIVSPSSSAASAPALLPALDLSLDPLFSFVRPALLLRLVESVALERRVVLTSSSISLLHLVSRGVLALLHPFTWQHTCVPVLLPAQFDLLSASSPCLLGVHSSQLPAAMLMVQKSEAATLVVDIDSDDVLRDDNDITTDTECRGFPQSVRDALLSTMRRLYRSQGEPDHGQAVSRAADNSETTSHRLRVAFVKAWCQLLSSYRSFVLHVYHPTTPSVLFDRSAFLRYKPSTFTGFLSQLTASSAFQAFVNQRCTPVGLTPVTSSAFDCFGCVLSGERPAWQQVEREQRLMAGTGRLCVARMGVVAVGEASIVAECDDGLMDGAMDGEVDGAGEVASVLLQH